MSILLANHCDSYNQRLSLELIRQGMPVHTIVSTNLEFFRGKKLNKARILDIYDFYYADRINKLNKGVERTLSKQEILEFQDAAITFLTISDRLMIDHLSVRKRLDLFYELLLFWLNYIEAQHISAVIFAQTPHTGYENIIYSIARYKKIPSLIVSPTLISDRVFIRQDYLENQKVPLNFKQGFSRSELISEVGDDLYTAVYGDGPWLKTGKDINTRVLSNNQGNVVVRVIIRLIRQIATQPRTAFQNIFSRSTSSGFVFNRPISNLEGFFISVWHYLPKKSLAQYYEKLCGAVSLKKKYIYFPLHYQPERTTMPEGGVFEHQLLALRILSKSIPKNWTIYVKEHPRQFSLNDTRTNSFRDRHFYDSILKLGNTRLVPVGFNSESLIRRAQTTATIQGSASWESILAGKASLAFASPWYGACNSCYQVNSVESCKKALVEIAQKDEKKVELDLLKFLLFMKKQFVVSAFLSEPAEKSTIQYDTLVHNLATALKMYYEKVS